MKFSYSAIWEDTISLLRSHLALVVAIAAAFIFLPNLVVDYFLPEPQAPSADLAAMLAAINDYWRATWHWHLLDLLVNMLGTLSILILVFDHSRPTVAAAIVRALSLLPFYILASIALGLLLLVICLVVLVPLFLIFGARLPVAAAVCIAFVPAAYLYGRTAPLPPIIVAEHRRNPIDAITRSFAITARRGWTIFALLVLVAVAVGIPILAISFVAGSLLVLLFGQDFGTFVLLIITTALKTGLTVLLVLLLAAIYRRLTSEASASGAVQ